MEFRLYFIVTFIMGIISYTLNWNSLINTDPNCKKDITKISNKLLFTISIVLLIFSYGSIFKAQDDIQIYPIIFLCVSILFIILSIINLVNAKEKNSVVTTTTSKPITTSKPTTTPTSKPITEFTECVNVIVSLFNLLIGILLGIFSIYYLKNEIYNLFVI